MLVGLDSPLCSHSRFLPTALFSPQPPHLAKRRGFCRKWRLSKFTKGSGSERNSKRRGPEAPSESELEGVSVARWLSCKLEAAIRSLGKCCPLWQNWTSPASSLFELHSWKFSLCSLDHDARRGHAYGQACAGMLRICCRHFVRNARECDSKITWQL